MDLYTKNYIFLRFTVALYEHFQAKKDFKWRLLKMPLDAATVSQHFLTQI